MAKNINFFLLHQVDFVVHCLPILNCMKVSYTIELLLFYDFLVRLLKINPKIYANITAAEIPPAVAVNPPVNTPSNPFSLTASIAPFAKLLPNPVIGTVAPALAKLTSGSYNPNASIMPPNITNSTSIRALVKFVLMISNCPSIHINPPTTKTLRYNKNISINPPMCHLFL